MTLRAPHLLAISDGRASPNALTNASQNASQNAERPALAFTTWLRNLAAAWRGHGANLQLAVQVREKSLPDKALLHHLVQARDLLPEAVPVLVNGRYDLALQADIAGVHLPTSGPPAAEVREAAHRAGRTLLVGRSTHTEAEVAEAQREGVDYITFGPIHPTPSKARYGRPPGLPGLRAAVRSHLPVLALGGIAPPHLPAIAATGAHGAAAIRAFHNEESAAAMLQAATAFLPRR